MSSEPLLRVTAVGRLAIHDVTFTLDRARTLAIVGASGSGKSTLARAIAGIDPPATGEVRFDGRATEVQLIPQQPAASLNPRFTAAEIVAEPLLIQRIGTTQTRARRAAELMELVGLPAKSASKPALAFSGGERQRLAIARALALEPKLLILDESLTGLDPALASQISRLLVDLQQRLGLAYILISHDLDLVARLASEIAVMDGGTIVEHAPTAELLANPKHPRTRELRDAALALAL
jgi:ABC-type glutathione transport system ATPase component